jgi:general secretion pathway protein K
MMVASRAQADQYAQAGLDWARGVITMDPGNVDSLADGWAQPIAGLPVDRAIVSGDISDEQGKFNLNNLVVGNHKSPDDVEIFQRLLASLGLDPALADAVVDWIDTDSDLSGPGGAEDPYYLALPRPYRAANQPFVQVEELYRVRGFDAKSVAALLPYVTALPATARTTINVNTADPRVLAAALPNVPSTALRQLVAQRAKKPFVSSADVALWASAIDPKASTGALDVKSSYFGVHVRVAQDDVQLATDALVARATVPGQSAATFVWRRPRY